MLTSGMASAQVVIKGDVHGGGLEGKVKNQSETVFGDATVTINDGTVEGSVYGGGKGVLTDETSGLVEGNTTVTMKGGCVQRSIYGGGDLGSVGTFSDFDTAVYVHQDAPNDTVYVPKTCASGTGLAQVTVTGGSVGLRGSLMPWDDHNPDDDDRGWIFCGSRGEADSITYPRVIAMGVVNATHLEINKTETTVPLITASVYGGCENGLVLDSTFVKIMGGQIGTGLIDTATINNVLVGTFAEPYTDQNWSDAINAVKNGTIETALAEGGALHNKFYMCDAWPYGYDHDNDPTTPKKYDVYDIYYDSLIDPNDPNSHYRPYNTDTIGSNGQSFFGNVFGGGSGYYPIAPGVWRRTAGRVNGNTRVEITGGHILTSVYGGNEVTDVMGRTTIKMSGGTIGVPRSNADIQDHPVLCNLFGSGKGDQRVWANKWTNVDSTIVEFTGGTIFGSIFGGGEDGHVLGSTYVTVDGDNALIGTLGYSGFEGQVYGSGRGFSGDALTAGNVGGNTNITIESGTILGSIYGGGRNASVGPKLWNTNEPLYGQMQPDDEEGTHGHTYVTINGGVIGNDYESKLHRIDNNQGGNVYGGSMGAFSLLDGSLNTMWPRMSKVKSTNITIDGENTIIKGNVFGGCKLGTVTESTSVTLKDGTVWGSVYGSGYGSDNNTYVADNVIVTENPETHVLEQEIYPVTPRRHAGRVYGNTTVTLKGGWVKKNVYGGGDMASVGTITDEIFVHSDIDSLSIGWPVRLTYKPNTGTCAVNINGGRIGITGNDFMGPWNTSNQPYDPTTGNTLTAEQINAAREDNGQVFGGGKGKVGPRREMAELADYVNTEVTVEYPSSNTTTESNFKPNAFVSAFYSKYSEWTDYGSRGCIVSNLYGAAENGHIHDDTEVTLENGLIGGSLYGGGKGTDMYTDTLWVTNDNGETHTVENFSVHSVTAGKVFGNTNIIMNNGQVLGNVYGGGEYASVGKGNYLGYGEKTGSQATADSANYVLTSGKCFVTINGGTVGSATWNHNGNVFGSSKGLTFTNVQATPRYNYSRDFFLGYANFTNVTIGGTTGTGPTIRGSVFGGGENGHVRFNTEVTINKGEIGDEYAHIANADERAHRGNVYGAGQGIDKIASTDDYCNSAGSVTLNTKVTVNGGTIHRNIYGGGSLASVGPPPVKTYNPGPSLNEVIIKGGTIGEVVTTINEGVTTYNNYGGDIFGAGRGIIDEHAPFASFATSHNTKVTLDTLRNGNTVIDQAFVIGNVYGGGELGQVKHTTQVDVKAGMVGTIGYTWKHDSDHTDPAVKMDSVFHKTGGSVFGGGRGDLTDPVTNREAALVTDTTHVTISGGHVQYSVYGGGEVASVGLRQQHRYKYNGVWYDDYLPKQSQTNADSTGVAMVTIKGGQVGPSPRQDATHNVEIGLNGVDGYVFGGGKGIGEDYITNPAHPYSGGTYYAIADVNNTFVTVDMPMPTLPITAADTVNRIWGSTFGGSEDGHVLGSARTYYKNGLMGTKGTTTYDGNIFGGGRNFNKKNYNAGRVRVNDSIDMCGGQIYGSIFGGGRLALTGIDLYGNILPDTAAVKHGNTFVKVSGGMVGNDALIEEWISSSMGDVYGAGKGDTIGIAGHPKASALLVSLVKNTEVLITDTVIGGVKRSPRILGSVFGGGEVANVGHFTWKIKEYAGVTNIGDIEPLAGTGKTKVTVKGGVIGAEKSQMRVQMAGVSGDGNYNLKYNDDRGHVFGGGEGWVDDPTHYSVINPTDGTPGIHNNKRLIDLMAIVGETEVNIGETDNGSAYVKGSVYGGAMNGHVLRDTKVTISGGQIGAGYNPADSGTEQDKYDEDDFINPITYFETTYPTATDVAADDALLGCYQWDYVANNQRPFDPIALKTDTDQENHSNSKPTNGETWFGSVYGGGSGYYPYIIRNHNNTADSCVWNPDAGKVFGHTEVEITGGHILSNVYGGCQTTDVADKAVVSMSGGTVGVPETMEAIHTYPYMGGVYGGGQGNFRNEHQTLNNVDSTRVTISGNALVYGMVFGGSQNGHVLDSTKVLVKGGVIGTTGLSGYDGHVFGGGQGTVCPNPGHPGDSLYAHAGRVGGNARVIMTNGKALGNLYGGGMVALTGVGESGWFDDYTTGTTYQSDKHGMAKVELSGGSVGNDFNDGNNLLKSTYASGNVYGGGRGKLDEYDQDDLGRSANSAVKISGSPTVYGSVYGGGQMANVGYWRGYDLGWYATNTATTSVTITGSPKIGTELEFVGGNAYSHYPGAWTYYDTVRVVDYKATPDYDTTYFRRLSHARTGNVYGGGQGEVQILGTSNRVAGLEQGHCSTTNVNINMDNIDPDNEVSGGHIMGSVFGGSEQGVIWGETEVHIAGGTIGTKDIYSDSLKYDSQNNQWIHIENHATYSYGNVFGGSYGKDYYSSFNDMHISNPRSTMIDSVNVLPGRVYGNTLVDITGGTIHGNVFGGGDMASVGIWNKVSNDLVPVADPDRTTYRGNARVTVSGSAVIGPLDGTGMNAYVFGGGKGFSNDPDGLRKEYANVDSTFVTVSGGKIWGSVFGGGSDSHVLGSTSVTVNSGANIGDNGLTTWDGNIFGGGRNFQNNNHTNGRVAGNIYITMTGGTIQGTIFGGGRLALSGVNVDGDFLAANWDVTKHGNVNIKVSGDASTVIGNGSDQGIHLLTGSEESVGDIFGSGKGDTKAYMDTLGGRVTNATISITGSPRIHGAVFGGGEMASLGWWDNDHQYINNTGEATITIGRAGESDNPVIGTFLELDSDYLNDEFEVSGQQYDHSDWTMFETVGGVKKLIHTCTGNVFGGCQGDVDFEGWDPDDDGTWNNWPYMGRSRKSTVTINGGTIMSCVFGGPEQGTMDEDAHVIINGGTIGTEVTASDNSKYYHGGVFGAGYGSDDEDEDEKEVVVYGDTYTAKEFAGRVFGNVLVDVLGGTIQGDVFGGASFAYVGGDGANPKGDVQVNIGSSDQKDQPNVGTTIKGSVFGANNHSGTPFGNVNVDVYHTKHTDYDQAPEEPSGGWTHSLLLANAAGNDPYTFAQQYALKEVYGGGNQASFTPNATRGARSTTVHVHYCENTIKDLYGGSNAADIGTSDVHANDSVIVDGGRFYRVFGGGNGTTTFANVHGTAVTRINAGVIQEVYGGGNHNGIIDDIDLEITHDNAGTCGDFIYDVFGGNNEAEVIGDIVSVINCGDGYQYEFYGGNNTATIYGNVTTNVFGGETAYLFGGSKGRADDPETPDVDEAVPAHIRQFPSWQEINDDMAAHPGPGADTLNRKYSYNLRKHMRYDPNDENTFRTDLVHTKGNVTLNIFGGTISQAALGGSDENGTIDGKITVNVFDAQTSCNLDLNNLYGAGRNTDYVPIYTPETGTERISPVVNVIHGTVQGSVYGGGMGASATVEASPVVNIGYADVLADTVTTLFDTIRAYYSTWSAPAVADYTAHVNFNVFGGGNEGQVEGNTSVNINKNNTIIEQFVYGAGCGNDTDPDFAKVTGNSSVRIYDGLIKKVVFGGGNTSIVTGNTLVEMSGGEVGNEYAHTGSIFGGGRGCTNPPGSSDDYSGFGRVMGNTNVSISGNAKIYKNVYGGGQIGSVGSGVLNNNTTGVTHVTISGGTIGPFDKDEMNANVFGGSQGFVGSDVTLYTNYANVDSTSVIVCDSAWVQGSVFGGGENGHVLGGTRILVEHGPNTKSKTPVIGTTALENDGHVFGGGLGTLGSHTAGRVGGNTKIVMTDGTVKGSLYGGGQVALTGVKADGTPYLSSDSNPVYDSTHYHGLAEIDVSGGTIGIGGTDAAGLSAARKLLESDYSIGDIFGSGQGDYDDVLAGRVANAKITVSGDPTIYCSVFGGGELAGVGYWREVGGKQKFYDKSGVTSVTIGGTPKIGTELEFTEGYMNNPTDWTVLDTINNVVKLFHTCSGNIFGGSQGDAAVTKYPKWVSLGRSKDAYVHIQGSPEIMSSVFGGAEQGTVAGNTRVKIEGGTIGKNDLDSHIVTPNGSGGYTFTPGNIGKYSFGNVFGGGYGVDSIQIIGQSNDSINYPTANANPSLVANVIAGRVYGNTRVDITDGQVHGNVFGGGNMASVGQWTEVKDDGDNLIDFAPVANTGEATVNVGGKAIIGPMDGTGLNAYVFGGGKGIGNDPDLVNNRNKYCNVNSTHVTVSLTYASPDDDNPEYGWSSTTDGRIYGSVYGGGSDCHVLGDTYVTINSGIIGTYKNADEGITTYGGNIFGGGRNFLKVNYAAGRVAGNTNIEMNGGYVYGAIFGGGRHAMTGTGLDGMTMRDDVGTTDIHGKTTVKVKGGTVGYKPLVTSFIDRPIGEVYGGGKGSMEGIALSGHPAASPLLIAMVKNTEVEISETTSAVPTRILNTVYGGGEMGNVGHYTWSQPNLSTIEDIALRENTGKTKVTVKGGRIGMDRMVMSYELKTGTFLPATNPVGNVFGGGKGLSDDPTKYATNISTSPFGNKNLLDLMATVGYTTVVVENDGSTKPWVKGSVYGGAACGHVLHDTDVTIAGGQIGAGDGGTADIDPYDDDQFVDASSVNLDLPANSDKLLKGTYHWDYDPNTLRPFDLVTIYNGQTNGDPVDTYKPTDGKTWYGNVYGGGSGFLPYVKNEGTELAPVYKAHWNRESGKVYGNTRVEIKGGHILSCVYGGCETADVGLYEYDNTIHGDVHTLLTGYTENGTAKVIMKGGTVGVPRTTTDIQNHPIPGYVYGSGKGDPRLYFNTWTNVYKVMDTISGGKIYGCVFGSGEDGHVLGDVALEVSEADGTTIIGSTGVSKADGNIFGGGRGTTSEALTAGSVGGNVNVSVLGGTMLGSVYGGGNLASVGIYLVDKFLPGTTTPNDSYYGKFQPGNDHGHITVEISGGTIGNSTETPTHTDPHTIGGNVYGGSRGKFIAYSGSGDKPIWPSLARAKQTKVTVKGTATVKNSVYGGGEIGTVRDDTEVNIEENCTIGDNYAGQYCGHVFGGGKGFEDVGDCLSTDNDSTLAAGYLAGHVYGNTYVNIKGGHVWENVFGGGQVASTGWVKNDGTMVKGLAKVNVTGGIVGPLDYTGLNAYIFGGPKGGSNDQMKPYVNLNSTEVEVNYTTSASNRVWGSLFGGGSDGHVIGDAKVTLKSGTVGTDGTTGYDGNIFGGGRNYRETSLSAGRVGGNIDVIMQGGTLQGNIYGGGRQGLTGVDGNGDAYTTSTDSHGNITVTVSSGTIGTGAASETSGHVYGGGKGQANNSTSGYDHSRLGEVRSTAVTIQGDATVSGSVFGGSENGWVLEDASATIAGTATIGSAANNYQGNVFGGGRGIKPTPSTAYVPEAGRVKGMSRANINGGTVKRYVFGGGDCAIVEGERIVNVNGGIIGTAGNENTGDVYGGSNAVPDEDGTTTPPTLYDGHGNLKTVNVRGGTILGDVYGSSHSSNEGTGASNWSSFVNITGGTIGDPADAKSTGHVYGAGYEGEVNGKVSVNIGLSAVNPDVNVLVAGNTFYKDGLGGSEPTPAKIKIKGNVFDGSNYFGTGLTAWNTYDIEGSSATYLDGTGYNTADDNESSATPYMNIAGGLYGSGTHCESGKTGRAIHVRNYGARQRTGGANTEMTSATRTLTTIQRGGVVLFDNSNIILTGAEDISHQYENYGERKFGLLEVDEGFYMANGSGLVLGTAGVPILMDSIKEVRSVYLKTGTSYAYPNPTTSDWELVGIKDNTSTPGLYRTVTGSSALTMDAENVILFNGLSKLMVRYRYYDASHPSDRITHYGALYGFFRMKADDYSINDEESFARARVKLTYDGEGNPIVNPIAGHTSAEHTEDGGFLSYNNALNDFTKPQTIEALHHTYTTDGNDGGTHQVNGIYYNRTKQYPYSNLSKVSKMGDRLGAEDYRLWALPATLGHKWYVDGRGIGNGGWGKDATHAHGWGDYPDKPKKTITGTADSGGICVDQDVNGIGYKFNPAEDIIFVVGPIDALSEEDNLNLSATYPLRLYRYPGGHLMSNGKTDAGGGTAPTDEAAWGGFGSTYPDETKGPGVNTGAMINANKTATDFVLNNVVVDGLFSDYDGEVGQLQIPTTYTSTERFNVTKPLVVTAPNGRITLKGSHTESAGETVTDGTILKRGYNKTDAATTWLYDADYSCYTTTQVNNQPVVTVTPQGGALFVDKDATVNVEGLVSIESNKQKKGTGTVTSNVYLPTFDKSLTISGPLDVDTKIGVTSPVRNTSDDYRDNTLSPVASAETSTIAETAWQKCNFTDDLGWFFVRGNKIGDPEESRTTYYNGAGTKNRDNKTLYFGWTWASVVRTAPTGYSNDNIDSPEDLAWLITSVPDATIKQTADLDMGQYVWVPIGSNSHYFAGTYDGQGHLIKNLYIDYIGTGDKIYERTNYGLFGNVHNGTVNRTFVVSGRYEPYVSDLNGTNGKNIGGLVGYMEGTSMVSNSEAAVMIMDFNNDATVTGNVMGGLVAMMNNGEIHSSMAMDTLSVGSNYHGVLGGLVGSASAGAINNSFANGAFSISSSSAKAGGLVGDNVASVRNCYVTWNDSYVMASDKFGSLVARNSTSNNIQNCYVKENITYGYVTPGNGSVNASCKQYSPVYSADMLGYMYADNKIEGDTAMFVAMNRWVTNANNSIPHKYATWARPGLQEINGDLPVLLLSEFDGTKDHQGGFRSLSTYEGGLALQYGGPVRDTIIGQALNTWSPQLDGALTRATAGNSIFIYGDVVCAPTVPVSADKVSIYEDASILHPGSLVTAAGGSKVEYDDTYVGITFDNSKKSAVATYGVNYGLSGGTSYLNRDWHMFSTPLSSAPLGFDYKAHNVKNLYTSGDYSSTGFYNNPWADQTKEFTWLRPTADSTNVRYWMKGWNSSQSPRVPSTSPFDQTKWVDGYFPSNIPDPSAFGATCVAGTDEDGRYPYGMDFYTWTEPDYHWINFKRNGPNHWHSDGDHLHINYVPVVGEDENVNEENLIVGRGYMASIATQTFLQSHGTLNAGPKSIAVTKTGTSKVPGWNLVGNPYHGYIDFDKLALNNGEVLDIRNSQQFYVVYDADGFGHGGNMEAGSAFLYYAVGGSTGGEYADRYIHPHQGFYVLAKDYGGTLSFNENMLVGRAGITSSFRDDERPAYPLVNLYLSSDNGCNDVTVIELERPEWGGARKIRELRNGNGLFYAQHDNTHFAALFAVVGTERVPLWFEAKEDDIYTIKWNTANGNFHSMYLIDNKLGVHYDMLRNDTYSFEGHVGDYPSRFYIVFNVTDVDEHLGGDGFVFFDDSQWIVTGEGDLEFIDVQGQVLLRKHVNGGQSRVTVPDVAPGVYLFRLSNSNGTRVQKVIVKR